MSETEQEWEGLADRVRAGDDSAEADLVSVFQGRVHCLILARTRSLAAARALTPEALLRPSAHCGPEACLQARRSLHSFTES